MAPLGQEWKNLQTELKQHRINALEGNQRPVDPNQKERQNATRFCGYCRTNGHTPKYCRKKMRDEEVKKLQNEATAEKKVTFTHDYNKGCGPSRGSGNWTKRTDSTGAMISTPRSFTRGNSRPSTQDCNNFRQNRPFQQRDYSNNTNDRYNDSRARSQYQSDQDQSKNWGSDNFFPDCLQRYNNIHPSRIIADNRDQIRLIPQCFTGLGIETQVTIYPTTRNSRLPTTVSSQMWFASLRQTMKLMNYRDYALKITEVSEFNY